MSFRGTSSLLALLALSTPALADVTPAEVWQNWVDYYKVNGYSVTEGARDEAGDTLTLSDVAISREMPDGKLNVTLPKVQLQATGDGKVRTTADTMTADLDSKDSDGDGFSAKFSASMPGSEILSSGTADDMTHEGKAPTVTLKVDEVKTKDQTLTDIVTITSADNVFSQHVVTGDKTRMDYNATTGQTDVVVKAAGKDDDGRDSSVDGTVSISSLNASGTGVLPAGVNMDDVAAALRAGMMLNGTGTVGKIAAKFTMTQTDEDGAAQPANVSFESNGVSVQGGLSVDGLNYQVDGDGFSAQVSAPDMPFPIMYSTDSVSAALQLPVAKTDVPMPFKFAYSIAGLKLGDEIWNMFDPEKKLPRDPASLELDVTGMTRLDMDLFDPENMKSHHDDAADNADNADMPAEEAADDAAGGDAASDLADTAQDADASDDETMPFKPTVITLNQFLVDAVGAKLTANGELTVPEGADVDAAVGKISARYEGVNGLIDKLVDMGVVSKEEVTGYRMMLAMFTKAAPEGGDVLTTDLEFKEGGSIFANGQQVK